MNHLPYTVVVKRNMILALRRAGKFKSFPWIVSPNMVIVSVYITVTLGMQPSK